MYPINLLVMVRISEEEDCPTNDFELGESQGTCWGDGHHKCVFCKHFRADFKADETLRDKLLHGQGAMQFRTLKPLPG